MTKADSVHSTPSVNTSAVSGAPGADQLSRMAKKIKSIRKSGNYLYPSVASPRVVR